MSNKEIGKLFFMVGVTLLFLSGVTGFVTKELSPVIFEIAKKGALIALVLMGTGFIEAFVDELTK